MARAEQTQSAVAASGDTNIDALQFLVKWGEASAGSGTSLTYSFPDHDSTWPREEVDLFGDEGVLYDEDGEPYLEGYAPFGAVQQEAARLAVQAWAEVADIQFVEVTESDGQYGDIRFAFTSEEDEEDLAHAYAPLGMQAAGDLWMNITLRDLDWSAGSDNFLTLLHELGHALGLKHPFDDEAGTGDTLPAGQDWYSETVMSYTSLPGEGTLTQSVSPITPMGIDIQAIQYLYGANTSTHAGNTAWSFATDGSYYQSIWDAGGTDTVFLSGSAGALLDLTPGAWSRIGGAITYSELDGSDERMAAIDTVYIPETVLLEHAVGGDGADAIRGNLAVNSLRGDHGDDTLRGGDAGDTINGNADEDFVNGNSGDDSLRGGQGDDTLHGGQGVDDLRGDLGFDSLIGDAGDDRLWGGSGIDHYVFGDADGHDVIEDFVAGTGDLLVFHRHLNGQPIDNGADLLGRLESTGSDTLVHIGDGNSVLLRGVDWTDLTAADFGVLL